MTTEKIPIVTVDCYEECRPECFVTHLTKDGEVLEEIKHDTCQFGHSPIKRSVYELEGTMENLTTFYKKASQFPTIFGKQHLNFADFLALFWNLDQSTGKINSNGIFYVIDDFVGVLYITDLRWPNDALVHYTFFDRRHNGRVPIVKAMVNHVFKQLRFYRLSAEIPNYAKAGTRHFVIESGFRYEGKRRKCADYKGQRFDINLYGILDSESK